jgi:hypothetical protein
LPVIAWAPPGGDRGRCQPPGYLRQNLARPGLQLRDALIAAWGKLPDDPRVEPHVERGAAGWVLVSLARRPGDVLVSGAGRHGALARLASCKVSRYCAAHALCPVILIPPSALGWEAGRGVLAWVFWRRSLTPAHVLADHEEPAARDW